ncbi:type IV pilus assembly protein PilC [Natranaerovirga pectinivora]|uniref:Type IV pilus assembly protein PilC n=1 Tax=Natranaerovirga pectinivora TaxID=682400 RepID=A0A4R3MQ27_9FIRM|nr:type II secretion system F family protein [Natranaerovirga pectinivora]TCT16894.1 type IV pilus assembly protein PilC [Natranaerovirga pectinivora]
MGTYSYKALTRDGKNKKGTLEANNKDTAFSMIKENGWIPLSIAEQSVLNKDLNITFGTLVKVNELSLFCKQFVSILSAGLSVLDALDLLGEQTSNKYLKKAIVDIYGSVEKGNSLASSMANHPKIFPNLLVNMVDAGEMSGNLEIAFDRMATHFEKETKLKQTIKKATTYPIMVSIIAFIVVGVLVTFVVPSFVDMFDSAGMELPALTRILLSISSFIRHQWLFLILGSVGGLFALIYYSKSEQGKILISSIMLKLPLFGTLNIKVAASRFTRTLSTLLASGISLLEAIEIVAKLIDNHVVSKHLTDVKEQVSRGIPLSKPIKDEKIFPPMVTHMVKVGEDTGTLEETLNKVADFYDSDVETAVAQLTTMLEPLIIVILAVVVGFIVLSIIQPMFQMYDTFNHV